MVCMYAHDIYSEKVEKTVGQSQGLETALLWFHRRTYGQKRLKGGRRMNRKNMKKEEDLDSYLERVIREEAEKIRSKDNTGRGVHA